MMMLLILLPLSAVLLAIAMAAFVWAVRNGQFEELEGEGARILFDEEEGAAASSPPEDVERERQS